MTTPLDPTSDPTADPTAGDTADPTSSGLPDTGPGAPAGAEPRRRHRGLVIAATISVLALLTAVVAWLVVSRDSGPEPRTVHLVVEAGTQDRVNAGEKVVMMPSYMELRVGDTLFIENKDAVPQWVGPYLVGPGNSFSFTYGSPGRFAGFCPLADGQTYEIVVKE